MRKLADLGAIERVRRQAIRGALQTFYSLTAKECASSDLGRR
jgi:hypothetical protein